MADETTLLSLPTELLHKILSYFKDRNLPGHRRAIEVASRTCKRLRAIAAEFVFASGSMTVRVERTLAPFIDFLAEHPRVAGGLRKVRIYGINAAFPLSRSVMAEVNLVHMAMAAELMQSLDELVLKNVEIVDAVDIEPATIAKVRTASLDHPGLANPLDHHSRGRKRDRPQACSVKTLKIEGKHRRSSLSAVLAVLALFDIEHCILAPDLDFKPTPTRSGPSLLARARELRIRIVRLTVDSGRLHFPDVLPALFAGLARALVPGTLQSVNVECFWPSSVRALGALLRRAGVGLVELAVHQYFYKSNDPLRKSWRAINLIACPNLNALTLRLHLGAKQGTRSEPKHPPSAAIAELLARAPPSLTMVSIEVLGARDSDAWLEEPEQPLRHLRTLDVLLASSARFPALRHVRCRLHGSYLSRALVNAAKEAFENVQGRGMLEVVKG